MVPPVNPSIAGRLSFFSFAAAGDYGSGFCRAESGLS
jgi:hypothetical protein